MTKFALIALAAFTVSCTGGESSNPPPNTNLTGPRPVPEQTPYTPPTQTPHSEPARYEGYCHYKFEDGAKLDESLHSIPEDALGEFKKTYNKNWLASILDT